VKITCTTSTLTHYYVVKNGDSTMHMATYITAGTSEQLYQDDLDTNKTRTLDRRTPLHSPSKSRTAPI